MDHSLEQLLHSRVENEDNGFLVLLSNILEELKTPLELGALRNGVVDFGLRIRQQQRRVLVELLQVTQNCQRLTFLTYDLLLGLHLSRRHWNGVRVRCTTRQVAKRLVLGAVQYGGIPRREGEHLAQPFGTISSALELLAEGLWRSRQRSARRQEVELRP